MFWIHAEDDAANSLLDLKIHNWASESLSEPFR